MVLPDSSFVVNRIMLIEVVLQMFNNSLRTISYCFWSDPDDFDVSPNDGGIHLSTMSAAQVLSQTLPASEHMTTVSFENATKQTKKGNLTDEKREQINAKRRATYRRKKEEEAKKLDHENQAYGSTSGIIV